MLEIAEIHWGALFLCFWTIDAENATVCMKCAFWGYFMNKRWKPSAFWGFHSSCELCHPLENSRPPCMPPISSPDFSFREKCYCYMKEAECLSLFLRLSFSLYVLICFSGFLVAFAHCFLISEFIGWLPSCMFCNRRKRQSREKRAAPLFHPTIRSPPTLWPVFKQCSSAARRSI